MFLRISKWYGGEHSHMYAPPSSSVQFPVPQGWGSHGVKSMSQALPVYPSGQMHSKVVIEMFTQLPPFGQGSGSQGSMSREQL